MNLDELRTVQSKERQKDSLQNLRPSFYREVGEYIADLEAERDRVAERADDPFSSPEVGRLTDEIETARDVVEAIYERRMGKLVKQASLAAAGMPADDDGLTAEEQDLFGDLVDRIRSNKGRVLDTLDGVESTAVSGGADPESEPAPDGPAADSAPNRSEPGQTEAPPTSPEEPRSGRPPAEGGSADSTAADASGVSPADVMGGESAPIDESQEEPSPPVDDPSTAPDRDGSVNSPPSPPTDDSGRDRPDRATDPSDPATDDAGSGDGDVDRVTVRITRDVGPILGVDDREYTLSCDDVVTLPEQNATPLVDREAAKRLD